MRQLTFILLLFAVGLSASVCAARDTLYVKNGALHTAADEPLVMRGFNEMFVWSNDPTGKRLIPEINQSGANALRLVWDHGAGTVDQLIELIHRTVEHKMVAIPECHNATGKWGEALQACVDFWNNDALIETIERHGRWSIVNIANEAGDHSITDEQFVSFYQHAITSLRDWGYTVPIMIDAAGWGQNVDQLLRVAPTLLAHDPLGNIIFSTHSYWAADEAMDNYRKVAITAKEKGIAMIIGEGPSVTRVGQCDDPEPLPYGEGMALLEQYDTGWLNWSWGGMKNGDCDDYRYFDITKDGEFGQWWHTPGAEIVALSPAGVMQSSKRPASFYGDGKVRVSGVYLHLADREIAVGEQTTFDVIVAPANARNKGYQLRVSGDRQAVEIDANAATVKAVGAGQVTLTAVTDDGDKRWQADLTIGLRR